MSNYEVEVLVRGRPVKVFNHKGDYFIEGRKGSTFELKITNNTWNRIEVVTSVDGLSVINGEECGPDAEGYLVPARESIVIPGWKLPDNKAAQFVFEDKRDGYSNQVGKGTRNVGAIGFMVFEEKEEVKPLAVPNNPYPVPYPQPYPQPYPVPYPVPRPWYTGGYWTTDGTWISNTSASPVRGFGTLTGSGSVSNMVSGSTLHTTAQNACSTRNETFSMGSEDDSIALMAVAADEVANMVPDSFELGTGWGDEINHNVTTVEFNRKDKFNPTKILTLFYDSKKGLEARGIQVVKTKKKTVKQLPNAFPTYNNTGCKPPKNWRG